MSLKKEFAELVKEANLKIELQNRKKEEEDSKRLANLKKRQELLVNMLSKSESFNSLIQNREE